MLIRRNCSVFVVEKETNLVDFVRYFIANVGKVVVGLSGKKPVPSVYYLSYEL